jgi:succinoglycan biosynthesis transport protein ExoP
MSTSTYVVEQEPGLPYASQATTSLARTSTDIEVQSGGEDLGGLPKQASSDHIGKTLHRALRGRYPLAITLGLVTGLLAAAVVWRLYRPMYRSEGLVQIAYSLPEVFSETDQTKPVPMFDTYMQSQRLLMTSRRVIDMAIQDQVWSATHRAVPAEPDRFFATYLKVDVKPRSEYIEVSVTDPDPLIAANAVNSVITAYSDWYRDREKAAERNRISALEDRQTELQRRISAANGILTAADQKYGTSQLDKFYEMAVARVTKLESNLDDIRSALATATTQPATPGEVPSPTKSAAAMTVEQIAASDPVMLSYFNEQTHLEQELNRLYLIYGDGHKNVVRARQSLDDAKARTKKYAETYREFHTGNAQGGMNGRNSPLLTADKSPEVLRLNESNLVTLAKDARKAMIDLGSERRDLQQAEEQLKVLTAEQTLLAKRIQVLKAEGALGGHSRLTVVSTGEIALSPQKDFRIPASAGAGCVGAGLPATVLVLLSLLKRNYRYADETETDAMPQRAPLLGILPELEPGEANSEQMSAAAHSIHQVRVSLRARWRDQGSAAYLITSATSGEGKTSLTVSLGLSCAASGLRTLVIDGDLVGRKLTTTLHAKEMEGLHEAILAGSIRQRIRKADAGLFILPAGQGGPQHACAMPPATIRLLLAEAREYFDVILIDTGPILGSLEASVLAQEVDGVIFTIARGQTRQMVDQAMKRLGALGVTVIGCIFNRAKPEDFNRSPYGSSSRSASSRATTPATVDAGGRRFNRFGSLVQAVAAGLPASSN